MSNGIFKFVQINMKHLLYLCLLYPWYEVYRGNIVFAFSVIMYVCVSVCLSVNFFMSKISQQLLDLGL